MQYQDSFQQAAEYVRQALPLMAAHAIPANPQHYTVWYEYVSGRNEPLKQAIEEALGDKSSQVSPEFSYGLYEEHFRQAETRQAEALRTEVRERIGQILEQVVLSGDQAQRYGNMLTHYNARLEEDLSTDEFRTLLNDFIQETHSMQATNQALQERLNATQNELDELRQQLEEARTAAATDGLTGLYNRATLDRKLIEYTREASASGENLCLLMADIDHFKVFNDTHGHIMGDKLLRLVATILNENVKGQDVVARYGGEEFVILLPNTPLHGALAVAEHLRATVRQQRLRRQDDKSDLGQVTLSLGLASYHPGEKVHSLIERADAALYQAKRNGRDRVVVDSQVPAA